MFVDPSSIKHQVGTSSEAIVSSTTEAGQRTPLHYLISFIVLVAFFVGSGSALGQDSFYPPPENHLRIMTWNLEVFNIREESLVSELPDRTDAQLNALAERINSFGASVIALQEINDVPSLDDLKSRLNAAGGTWQTISFSHILMQQQNAMLYDTSKVDLHSSEFVGAPVISDYPTAYPHENGYRAPVSAVFSPKDDSNNTFRVIGIHGSWQSAEYRSDQGEWLASYVAGLLADPDETDKIILAGDYNGAPGQSPLTEILAGGDLTFLPKSNQDGDITTTHAGLSIDHICVSDAVLALMGKAPGSFVLRPEYYGESNDEFRLAYSDHLPVLADMAVPEPTTVSLLLVMVTATFAHRKSFKRTIRHQLV